MPSRNESPVAPAVLLHRSPVVEHLLQLVAVDLDPFPLEQRQRLGAREELPHLDHRDGLAVEAEPHVEVEHGLHAQARRLPAPTGDLHLRARRLLPLPPVGEAHDHAARLAGRRVLQEGERLPRRPRKRVEDLAGVDERLDERAPLRGPLHGLEEREELALVAGRRVLGDGAPQGRVLHARLVGEPRGIGRQEGEGRPLVALVLGVEVEVDAPHRGVGRAPRREVVARRACEGAELTLHLLHEIDPGPPPARSACGGTPRRSRRGRLDQGGEIGLGSRQRETRAIGLGGRARRRGGARGRAGQSSRPNASDGGSSAASARAVPRWSKPCADETAKLAEAQRRRPAAGVVFRRRRVEVEGRRGA